MKRVLLFALVVGCRASSNEPSPAPLEVSAGTLRVSLPARADGVVHVERGPGAWIELRATHGIDAAARVEGDRVVYERPGVRITQVASAGRVEELRHVEHASPLAYRVHLGPKLARLRVVEDFVEALDDRGVALLRTEPAWLVDAKGNRRDLVPKVERDGDAWSLVWPIDDAGLSYPLDIDPAWTTTTAMTRPRRDNTLHLLSSGKVLCLAGVGSTGLSLSTAEIWDPATSSWTSAGALQRMRGYATAVALPSGKILAVGGVNVAGSLDVQTTVELFDPTTGTSTLLPAAPEYIGWFARANVLSPTTVLVSHDGGALHLDLSSKTWTSVPYLTNRNGITTTTLASGKVLVAGGENPSTKAFLSNAEVFDPSTKTWTAVAPMKRAHNRAEAVTLLTGKALVAGGADGESTAELYDPIADTWTLTPPMSGAHSFNTMLLLGNGKALNVGGDTATGISDRADLYDPVANTWSFAGKLVGPVDEFGAVALSGNRALIAGGNNGAPVATVQIFEPQANGKSCLGPGECTSGFCVDGACCEKSACAAGETCGGSGAPGTCRKKDGATCATDADCGSGHCVDGVCCATACADVCGACNLKGSEGTCTPVAAGDAPHGTRGACPGDGACAARCGGFDTTRCTQFPATPVMCAPAKCENGQESRARGCDGAGACAPVTPRDCAPYVCGATACKTQCDADADCVEGNGCDLVTRKCVIAATCDGASKVKSPDGLVKDCAPYGCAAGRCRDACTDSSACAPGFVCDTATSRCVVPAATTDDSSGGCALGASRSPYGALAALLLLALLGRRRA